MFYPYINKQTFRQWIMNTIDPRMWFRPKDCECCWDYLSGNLLWIVLGGCSKHD
jgi:hypothetical protein